MRRCCFEKAPIMHGLLRYYPSYYNVCFKSELICAINIILQTVKTVDVTVGVLVIRFWHAKKPDLKMSFIEPQHCAALETFSKCTPSENHNMSVLYDRSGTRYRFFFSALAVSPFSFRHITEYSIINVELKKEKEKKNAMLLRYSGKKNITFLLNF